jgi:hypothetical protein
MSNALAIAAVTAVLKDLLQNGLIDHDVTEALGDVSVTALPPDRVPAMDDTSLSQVNLFLYQVMPNTGWATVELPSHNSRGQRIASPPLALNLSYLVTAFGAADYHAEILLGYAMQLLHENGVIPPGAIRRALAPPAPVDGDVLPNGFQTLVAADLADQVELIKVSPVYMDTEEMSRLWGTLQTRYRPSMAYEVTVVLIERELSSAPSLPVLDYNVYARPFNQPHIDRLDSLRGPAEPIVSGDTLVITGYNLRGDSTIVKVGAFEATPAAEDLSAERIEIALPAGLRPGVQGVQVIHRAMMGTPETEHHGVGSNVEAFVLHPVIAQDVGDNYEINVDDLSLTDGFVSATVEVTLTAPVGRAQRVALLLNEFDPPDDRPPHAYSFAAPPRPTTEPETDTLTFTISGVHPEIYLIRVQVDGAASPLETDEDGQFAAPQEALT